MSLRSLFYIPSAEFPLPLVFVCLFVARCVCVCVCVCVILDRALPPSFAPCPNGNLVFFSARPCWLLNKAGYRVASMTFPLNPRPRV